MRTDPTQVHTEIRDANRAGDRVGDRLGDRIGARIHDQRRARVHAPAQHQAHDPVQHQRHAQVHGRVVVHVRDQGHERLHECLRVHINDRSATVQTNVRGRFARGSRAALMAGIAAALILFGGVWLDGHAPSSDPQPSPSSASQPASQSASQPTASSASQSTPSSASPSAPQPAPSSARPAEAPIQLAAGASHDREMQAGDAHRYTIDLREGEFVHARLEMRGVDVRVRVSGPDDGELLLLVSLGLRYGPEPIAFVAPATGRFRVDIEPVRSLKIGGRYRLDVDAVREPDDRDRAVAAAARAYAAASIAATQRTEDSGVVATRGYAEALAVWEAQDDRRQQAQTLAALGLLARHFLYDNPAAAAYWLRAVTLWRALDDEWGEAVAVAQWSESLHTLGDGMGALAARERARDLHRAAGRRAEEAAALDSLALVWIRLGEFQRTLELANEARAIFREVGHRRGEAYALSDVALVYNRVGEWDLAIDHYRQVQALADDDLSLHAIALTQIGLAQYHLGDLDAARASSEEALALCRKMRFRLNEGNLLSNLVNIYADQGDVAKGIEAGEAAQKIFIGASDANGQAIVAPRLGALYARRGDAQAARATYEAGLALVRNADPRNEALIHQGLGELERDAGHLPEARRHAEQGVALVESIRARVQSQRTRQSLFAVSQPLYELLADIVMHEHAANPAAGHDAAALEIAERARARSLLELLGEERVDVQGRADPTLLAQARTVRSRLNFAADALAQAQRNAAAAAARSRASTAAGTGANTSTGAGSATGSGTGAGTGAGSGAAAGTGRSTGASTAPGTGAGEEERVATIERQIAEDMEALEQVEGNLRRANPRYAALIAPAPLSTATLQRDVLDADTLLIEIMLGKSSSYLWVLSSTMLRSYRLPPRDEIERAARLVYDAVSTPPGAKTAVAHDEYERRARALSDLVLGPAASVLTARRLVIVAPGLLQYVPFAALPVPNATPSALAHASAPAGSPATTGSPASAGSSASADSSASAGSSGSQASSEPTGVARSSGSSRPPGSSSESGSLQAGAPTPASAPPSASASSSPTTFEPLIARFEVVTAPSASVVATLRRERAERDAPSRTIAILADPVFDANDPRVARARTRAGGRTAAAPRREATASTAAPSSSTAPPSSSETTPLPSALDRAWRGVRAPTASGPAFSRLPFSRLEADAIAAAAPRGAALKAIDFDATHAFATGPALADFRIVHFATHGVLHARQPDLSGVVLSLVDANGRATNGFLRLHEIYNLHLNADLVVLSGCQTALGKEVRGEGLVGLTRGFMYAGSPRVIASLWQVDDLATSELMARFYRNLFGGRQEPAAALRAAQLDLARSTRWRAPYFWAAFALQGDWQPPPATP